VRISIAALARTRPGRTATLRVSLQNRTAASVRGARVRVLLPAALRTGTSRSAAWRTVRVGRTGVATVRIRVGSRARPGTYRLTVRTTVGGDVMSRRVALRVR
jgi:hypothetical protein